MAGPFSEDNHLIFGQIGDGIHGRMVNGVESAERRQQAGDNNEPAVADRKFNEALNHLASRITLPRAATSRDTSQGLCAKAPRSPCSKRTPSAPPRSAGRGHPSSRAVLP